MTNNDLRTLAEKYTMGCIFCFMDNNDIPLGEEREKFIAIVRETREVNYVDIDIPQECIDRAIPIDDVEAIKKDAEEFDK